MAKILNDKPLLDEVSKVKKARAEILECRIKYSELLTELEGQMSKVNPTDEKEMGMLANLRLKAEIYPNVIAKAEKALNGDFIAPLVAAIESSEKGYDALRAEAAEVIIRKWEAILLPAAPQAKNPDGSISNPARQIASNLPILNAFASLWPKQPLNGQWRSWVEFFEPTSQNDPDAANYNESRARIIGDIIQLGEACLAVMEAVNKQGGIAPHIK